MTDKHSFMIINKSVLGQAPFSTSITVVGIAIVLLFTIIQPEASDGLEFIERFLFWTAQVSVSLIGILIASIFVRQLATANISTVWLILFTGLLASIVVSPGFVLIENMFSSLDRTPDSMLDEFAANGWPFALVVESIEVMPTLTITWFLVNIPILLNSTFIEENTPPDPGDKSTQTIEIKPDDEQQDVAKQQFLEKLPENIGKDVLYISSDLHYLNVTTTKGNVLILGSINKVSEIFDDEGFLVHRSHWVNKKHVVRVAITGNSAQCVMSNQKSIPISRSKRKLLKAYFGSAQLNPSENVVGINSPSKQERPIQ